MDGKSKIPNPTARRLSLYFRELGDRRALDEKATMSSRQLGTALGYSDAQVRKDLTFVGQLGHPGVGYSVATLHDNLRRILGRDRSWNAALVGAGNIGRALLSYRRFDEQKFHITRVFDSNPRTIGTTIDQRVIRDVASIKEELVDCDIELGIIAVPAEHAQPVAEKLIEAGVGGILNFAPRRIEVPSTVVLSNVDFTLTLEQLAFQLNLCRPNRNEEDDS